MRLKLKKNKVLIGIEMRSKRDGSSSLLKEGFWGPSSQPHLETTVCVGSWEKDIENTWEVQIGPECERFSA